MYSDLRVVVESLGDTSFFSQNHRYPRNSLAPPIPREPYEMISQQSTRSKRLSRPTYWKVLSLCEKEAAANKTEKAAQKEARKRAEKRKKAQLETSQSQLPSIGVSDDDLPGVVPHV